MKTNGPNEQITSHQHLANSLIRKLYLSEKLDQYRANLEKQYTYEPIGDCEKFLVVTY
jgi:hypothetical protein